VGTESQLLVSIGVGPWGSPIRRVGLLADELHRSKSRPIGSHAALPKSHGNRVYDDALPAVEETAAAMVAALVLGDDG
jgi:hypothetical protein